jgi:ABC-type uncharacterized transport system substrate-binding protein
MRWANRLVALLVAGVLLTQSGAVRAQDATKVYRIGYLGSGAAATSSAHAAAFREALRKLGYVEGRNIEVEYRWAEGRFERLPGLIEELINHRPELIIGFGGARVVQALRPPPAPCRWSFSLTIRSPRGSSTAWRNPVET